MKSAGVCESLLFTESYCSICNAQLISQSQRIAHYQSKKHASKVRLFYMLHPEDGGPPSKRLRPDNPDSTEEVDVNKCCIQCNMFFTSLVVAQSHYRGKTHTKRVRLMQGETETPQDHHTQTDPAPEPPHCTDSPLAPPPVWSWCSSSAESVRFCCLCGACFNNPLMARQHYGGKKHSRNAARAQLLRQLTGHLDTLATTGLRGSFSCSVCAVSLNSVEQYHAHLQGSKHQTNLKQQQKCDSSNM
ncbi:zinc finger matrin-type protein 4-like [Colossoma macropomum]|uniref:zinc finger matrin-type protein 4-like n=1 Tax=Colossoma macropomum TaxID=42526 RepID=UPI001864C5F8|nr:zinc finger matrin-type protein 4-like [Colossoma macropomum]